MFMLRCKKRIVVAGVLLACGVCVPGDARDLPREVEARKIFDQEILRLSQKYNRTILVENLPEKLEETPVDPKATDDLSVFLTRYGLGVSQSPGVLILYKKPTDTNAMMNITSAEAAAALSDIEKLSAPFVSFKGDGVLSLPSTMSKLLDSLDQNQMKTVQEEGLVVGSLAAPAQKLVTDLGNYCYIDSSLRTLRQTKERMELMASGNTKVSGENTGGKVISRAVAPNGGPSAVLDFIGQGGFFHFEPGAPNTYLAENQVSLLPPTSPSNNPLIREGTLDTVFHSLAKTKPQAYNSLAVDPILARKPIIIYSLGDTSDVRLAKGIATLYNLRVVNRDGKLLVTRHKPRTITARGDLRQELVRILPAPMLRVLTDDLSRNNSDTAVKDSDADVDLSDFIKELIDPPSGYRFSTRLKNTMQIQAAEKINNLLSASLKKGNVTRGCAPLREADHTGIYDRLMANVFTAEVLPDLNTLLSEPPAYITNMPAARLNIKLSEQGGKRTASLTVEAQDKEVPTRSSRMGVEVYSLPTPPGTQ